MTSIDERHEVSTVATIPDSLHPESYGLDENSALPVLVTESEDLLNSLVILASTQGIEKELDSQDVANVRKF